MFLVPGVVRQFNVHGFEIPIPCSVEISIYNA